MSDTGQIGIEGVPGDLISQQATAPSQIGGAEALQVNQPAAQPSPSLIGAPAPSLSVTNSQPVATAPVSAAQITTAATQVSSTANLPIRASDMTALVAGNASGGNSLANGGSPPVGLSTPMPGLDADSPVQLTARKTLTVDDQRYNLAWIFVITFAAGLLFLGLLVGAGIVNQIVNGTPAGQAPFFSFNDLIQLLTAFGTIVGTPLGFVVGYYFKGQEIANTNNAPSGGNQPQQ